MFIWWKAYTWGLTWEANHENIYIFMSTVPLNGFSGPVLSPSYGWCEVCVNGGCQAIVVEITVHARAEIHSLHHAAGGQNPQQGVEVRKVLNCRIVQGISQSFGWIYVDVKVLEKGNKAKSKNLTKILQTFKMWGWLYPSRWVAASVWGDALQVTRVT